MLESVERRSSGSVAYTLVVSNAGPSDDPAASFSDSFPGGLTCSWTSVAAGGATGNTDGSGDISEILSLPSGASVTYTAVCDIDSASTGTLSNTASASASVTDSTLGNNSATDDDTVLEPDDLSMDKIDSEDPVIGLEFAYTLEVTNHGPSTAVSVEATDTLPGGMTFVSSVGGCTESLGVITCPFGTMSPDDVVSRTFQVEIDPGLSSPISNTASVGSSTADSVPGNDSDAEESALDTEPPTITSLDTLAGSGDGNLAECEVVRVPIQSVEVVLTDGLSPIEGADDPVSYRLLGAGLNGDFSTTECSGPPGGDDVEIEIVSLSLASVDPVEVTATLNFANGDGIEGGLYRLLVCDAIGDAAGHPLDGDGNGTEGGHLQLDFRADPYNLFVNGHFDDCPGSPFTEGFVTLTPWVTIATPPDSILPGAAGDDEAGSPKSGSVDLESLIADPMTIAQCVDLDGNPTYDLDVRYRVDASPGVIVFFQMRCEQFDTVGCSGASLGSAATTLLVEDTLGAWETFSGEVVARAGAASALCDASFEPFDSGLPAFDAGLDALFLGSNPTLLIDGFESGSTSAWTSSTP